MAASRTGWARDSHRLRRQIKCLAQSCSTTGPQETFRRGNTSLWVSLTIYLFDIIVHAFEFILWLHFLYEQAHS